MAGDTFWPHPLDATMEGRCLEVTLDREHVTPGGITAQVFCYYGGLLDREPSTN